MHSPGDVIIYKEYVVPLGHKVQLKTLNNNITFLCLKIFLQLHIL